MQIHDLQVLAEGNCPFLGGPDFACCIQNLMTIR